MDYRTGCVICGEELVYTDQADKFRCAVCGKEFEGNARCKAGHFVCDACHSLDAAEYIQATCLGENETLNPVELAFRLMRHPSIKANGPEHHFLFPAVLITAWCNARGEQALKADYLAKARTRAAQVPGGFCGFCGACGAGIGNGIFVSVVTGATPLSGREWGLANQATAQALAVIGAEDGPRCCKRDGFLALQVAVGFVAVNLGTNLTLPAAIECGFSAGNKECKGLGCSFFPTEG